MKEVCVVGVYFGKFPPYFNLWLKSCFKNPQIDFLIFTDNEYAGKALENVRFIRTSLSELKSLFEQKLNMRISLERPYKCCEFKPAYGMMFEKYLKEYNYWGHCDFDMLFGDLYGFLKKYNYEQYDKFLPLGHLCLYRNTEQVNCRFLLDGGTVTYKEAFSSPITMYFDEEKGMHGIYKKHGFPYFEKRIFADISRLCRRFRLTKQDPNYENQVFYWENGKVYRTYLEKDGMHTEEFMYIHFSKRHFQKETFKAETAEAFFVGPEGFSLKQKGIPTKEEIVKFNRFSGKYWELLERKKTMFIFKVKRLKKIIGVR